MYDQLIVKHDSPLTIERACSSSSGDTPKCRICYEEAIDKDDPLIRPCKCSGSIRLAHKFCLQKWRMQASNPTNTFKCLVCNQDYRTTAATSTLKKLCYFYVLPGLESLIYSCCISYMLGYFMCPGEEASRAEQAICSPPFTPIRESREVRPSKQKPSKASEVL